MSTRGHGRLAHKQMQVQHQRRVAHTIESSRQHTRTVGCNTHMHNKTVRPTHTQLEQPTNTSKPKTKHYKIEITNDENQPEFQVHEQDEVNEEYEDDNVQSSKCLEFSL